MTEDEIAAIVAAAGNILEVFRCADGLDKAAIYRQLGLKLTFDQEPKTVIAKANTSTIMPACFHSGGGPIQDLSTWAGPRGELLLT
jgi:hypothetical protein